MHGNLTWNGLIYVMGNVGKSNGNNNINGAMMVKGTADFTRATMTVTLNRAILNQVCRSGFNNKMIVWKEQRQLNRDLPCFFFHNAPSAPLLR